MCGAPLALACTTRNAVFEHLIDGYEAITLLLELRKRDAKSLDSLAAVASPIVHEHDLPRLYREYALHDRIDAGTTPVERVDIPADSAVTCEASVSTIGP